MDSVRSLVEDAVRDVRAEQDALEQTMRRVRSRQRNRRVRAGATALVLAAAATTIAWKALVLGQDTTPAAPEGERILFTTGSATGPGPVIAVMSPDGSGIEIIGPGAAPAWSPDGREIAFTRTTSDGSTGVFVMNADGTEVRRLTTNPSGLDENPSWSPDGSSIVFSRSTFVTTTPDPVGMRARRDLYTIRLDGTGLTKLLGGPTDDFAPEWSPDGTRLGFVRVVDPASQGPEGSPQVWAVRPDGSDPEPLTALVQGPYRFDWSPDGSRLVLDAACAIYVVDVDDDAASRLRFEPNVTCPWDPAWSPDGARIVFTAGPDEDHDIYVANADGTGVFRLTDPASHDNEPAWWGEPAQWGEPTPTESSEIVCFESASSGDFDGDGRTDTATLHALVPFDRCSPEALETRWRFELAVELESVTVIVPFADCPSLFDCKLLEASDFDGDERSELPVMLSNAATATTGIYRVTEVGVQPLEVVPPADPGYLEAGPVRFGGGQNAIQRAGFECRVGANGSRVVIAWTAERDDGVSPFRVHLTTLELIGDEFIVVATENVQDVTDLPATRGLCRDGS